MKKCIFIIVFLFCFLLTSCDLLGSNEDVNSVSNLDIDNTPIVLTASEDAYGIITIESFRILNIDKWSEQSMVDYEIIVSCEENRLCCIGFYFVFYDEEGYRIGSSWFWEEAINGEKLKIKEDFLMPNETKKISFSPAM